MIFLIKHKYVCVQDRLRVAVLRSAAKRLAHGFAVWASVAEAAKAERQQEDAASQQVIHLLAANLACWCVSASHGDHLCAVLRHVRYVDAK